MPTNVVIVGAGRQGRNALEILRFDPGRFSVAGFLDDTKRVGETVLDCPVLGGFDRLEETAFAADHAWFVGLGDNDIRTQIGLRLRAAGATVVNAIHPETDLSPYCEIGVGVYIASFVRVGSASRIADWSLIESHCCIGNDTNIGDGAFLGPSVKMAGGSVVGALSFVGAGSVVSNDVSVGAGCTIGANAAVVRNVPDGTRAQGVPARIVPSQA